MNVFGRGVDDATDALQLSRLVGVIMHSKLADACSDTVFSISVPAAGGLQVLRTIIVVSSIQHNGT